jgi:hypothetical protein
MMDGVVEQEGKREFFHIASLLILVTKMGNMDCFGPEKRGVGSGWRKGSVVLLSCRSDFMFTAALMMDKGDI